MAGAFNAAKVFQLVKLDFRSNDTGKNFSCLRLGKSSIDECYVYVFAHSSDFFCEVLLNCDCVYIYVFDILH